MIINHKVYLGKISQQGGAGSEQNQKFPKEIFERLGGGQGEKFHLIFGILHRGNA